MEFARELFVADARGGVIVCVHTRMNVDTPEA